MNNNNNNLLKDAVKSRTILKEKLKNIKLNNIIYIVNILEDTFLPITKPLNHVIEKLESNNRK